jgi:hypothetical protein
MKVILIVLKTLVITYWALAATLFTSMLFFPSAIDTLYSGYTQFVEVIEVEEEPTCLALIPECGYEGEVEEPVTSEEETPVDPIPEESSSEVVEGEEPVTSEESSEPETSSTDGEAAEVEPSSEEEPVVDGEESSEPVEGETEEEVTEPSEEEEVVVDEETEEVTTEEEEVDEPIVVDFIPLTKEEFVNVLESILIYSAVSMLPVTLFVFSLGRKHRDLSASTKPEVEQPVTVTDASGKVKKSAKVKYESIGLTGLKIKK